jgi:hypothetical protein
VKRVKCFHCGDEIIRDPAWASGWAHFWQDSYYWYCDNPVTASKRPWNFPIREWRFAEPELQQTRLV